MKVSTGNIPPLFVPVDLVITFESEEEAEAFYSIFNITMIAQVCSSFGIDHSEIRSQIMKLVKVDSSSNTKSWKAFRGLFK